MPANRKNPRQRSLRRGIEAGEKWGSCASLGRTSPFRWAGSRELPTSTHGRDCSRVVFSPFHECLKRFAGMGVNLFCFYRKRSGLSLLPGMAKLEPDVVIHVYISIRACIYVEQRRMPGKTKRGISITPNC